jgi:hypothetical protein
MQKLFFFTFFFISLPTFAQTPEIDPGTSQGADTKGEVQEKPPTLKSLQKQIDSLSKKIKKSEKLFKSPVRLTIGGNFSNLEKVAFRSYYARFSFYKDGFNPLKRFFCDSVEVHDKCSSNKSMKKKRQVIIQTLDLGLYTGFFKQSYLNRYSQPNSVQSYSIINQITSDSLFTEKRYFRVDSSLTTLDQIGFFLSPNILLAKQYFGKKKFVTIRANFDIEYLKNFETVTNISTALDTQRNSFPVDSLQSINTSFQTQEQFNDKVTTYKSGQRFIGGGFSIFYAQKNLDFLYKLAFGGVIPITDAADKKERGYLINYFCASHIPTGIRLGGEIRKSYNSITKSSNFNYNIFIAYSIDFQKLAALYPNGNN